MGWPLTFHAKYFPHSSFFLVDGKKLLPGGPDFFTEVLGWVNMASKQNNRTEMQVGKRSLNTDRAVNVNDIQSSERRFWSLCAAAGVRPAPRRSGFLAVRDLWKNSVYQGMDMGQWHCERNGELLVLSSHEGSRPHLHRECGWVPRKTV